ncbi:MAG: YchF/TatD family DNA exonuclease [bacterium]
MAGYVDAHTHLELPEFDADCEETINRAKAAGVEFICTVGIEPKYWKRALAIAEKHDFIYTSLGVHPHEALIYNEKIEKELLGYLSHSKCLMLGEIGLDFFKNYSPREKQREVFERQLAIAEKIKKPVMIHIRDAHKEAKETLRKRALRGVIHCFSGTIEDAKDYISMGYYISIPGTVTFKKATNVHDVVRAIPLDFILSETDAPFITPEPFRGKRNEPAFVKYTVKGIAEIKNLPEEDVKRTIYANTMKIFNIKTDEEAKIFYKIRNSLYINITNRCTNRCVFCGKQGDFFVKGHYLKLPKEPAFHEILNELPANISQFDEIVFCGYGEPTLRLELIKELAKHLKTKGAKKIRLNTDGLANLRESRNVVLELKDLIDAVSISLNASDRDTYEKLCQPSLKGSFESLIEFIKSAKENIKEVTVSAVSVPGLDIKKIRTFAEEELKVNFRERPYDELG